MHICPKSRSLHAAFPPEQYNCGTPFGFESLVAGDFAVFSFASSLPFEHALLACTGQRGQTHPAIFAALKGTLSN